jgi:outer membrane protein assembly factor BamB
MQNSFERLSNCATIAGSCLLLTFAISTFADEPAATQIPNRLTNSAQVLVLREVTAALDRAKELIQKGKNGPAVLELSRLSRSHHSQLVQTSVSSGVERHEAVFVVVSRLLDSLPANARRLYELQIGERAERQLRDAIDAKSLTRLLGIARRFPRTNASRLALRHLIARHLDAGRCRPALGAIRLLESDPSTNAPTRKRTKVQRELCLKSLAHANWRLEIPATVDLGLDTRISADNHDVALRAHVVPQLDAPVWSVAFHDSAEWKATVPQAIHEHAEQSIPVLPRARPLVNGRQLLIRTSEGITALDSTDGSQLWRHAATSGTKFGAERAPFVPSLRGLLAKSLAREIQLDSVHSKMIGFRDDVCYIAASSNGLTNPPRDSKIMPLNSRLPIAASNQLVARNIKTGKLSWVVDGRSLTAKDDRRVYFLGVPSVVSDQLFGIAQVGENVFLYVLGIDGRLLWKCKLAGTRRTAPADLDWRSLSCRVLVTDGVAVCTTNAGIVVCVDLLSRSIRWSYRYKRDDLTEDAQTRQTNRPNREWWNGWREPSLSRIKMQETAEVDWITRAVLFAGPDQHGLVALDLVNGSPIWSRSVVDPVESLGVFGNSAIVLKRHRIESFNASSGEAEWGIDAPEPNGQGVIVRQKLSNAKDDGPAKKNRLILVYPTIDQRVTLVDLTAGRVLGTVPGFDAPGNLSVTGNRIIFQSLNQVASWTTLNQWLSSTAKTRVDQDYDFKMLLAQTYQSLGLLSESGRRYEAIAESLAAAKPAKNESQWQQQIRDAYQQRFRQSNDWRPEVDATVARTRLTEARNQLEAATNAITVSQRINAWIGLARAAKKQQQFVFAMDAYLAALELNPEGQVVVHSGGVMRRVLIERLIQGELLALIDLVDSKTRVNLHGHFKNSVVDRIMKNQDPFAKQRAAQRMQSIAWARPIHRLDAARIGIPFYRQQLELLSQERLAQSSLDGETADSSTRLWACRQLADLFASRSYEKNAAPWQWKLRQQLREDEIKTLNIELPTKAELLRTVRESNWSTEAPTVDTSGNPTRLPMRLVEIHSSPSSPFSRLDAFVSNTRRSGQTLVFCGDGHPGQWRITLPHSDTPFRQVMRPEAWGIGQFFVLRLGAELFGITPFAPNGQPRSRIVWSQKMDPKAVIGGVRLGAKIPGVKTADVEFLDPFARPVGQVGPVLPGFLCYRSKGKLCCIQTATGKLLWERYELPRRAMISGDSDFVFVVTQRPTTIDVCVVRAADGSTVRKHSTPIGSSTEGRSVWSKNGQLFVRSQTKSGGFIQAIALLDARVLWKRQLASRDRVFAVDEELVGLASRKHGLLFLGATTGQKRFKTEFDWPDDCSSVFATNDYLRTYVVYSRKPKEGMIPRQQILGNFTEYVDGGIIAVDRWTRKQHWHRTLTAEQFNWTQPNGVPFLVLSYTELNQDAADSKRRTVFHLIDKRNGSTIHREVKSVSDQRYVIELNAPQNWIRLQTTNRSIQLNFNAALDVSD